MTASQVAAATLQRRLFDECEAARWDPDKRNTFAEEIAHLHEEVAEAFREWRLHQDCEIRYVNGKPTGIPIEFADVLIGLFYNAELHGFDLLQAVEIKHRYNLTRDYVTEGRMLHPPADVVTASRTDRQPPASSSVTKGGEAPLAASETNPPDLVAHHEETDRHVR